MLQPFPSKYPDSPLKAAALFLAGKAAQQSNTVNTLEAALTIFQTLGAGTTQFAQAAKIEEASVLLRMGKADQCIAVLDELLSKPLPRYMRLLALSIQADAWVTKEDTHSDTLRKAINLCTEILNTPNLGLAWKFKTLTQRAQFYERLNDQEKALDDYASVLVHTPSGSSANKRRDWHWFYNAGFASIRLMGQAQNWDGALALARKLAQTSGPRAREAAAYARRIQLEHFIWQEDPAETEQPPGNAGRPGTSPPVSSFARSWTLLHQPEHGESTRQPSSWMPTDTSCWAKTTAAIPTGIFPRGASSKMKALNVPCAGSLGGSGAAPLGLQHCGAPPRAAVQIPCQPP